MIFWALHSCKLKQTNYAHNHFKLTTVTEVYNTIKVLCVTGTVSRAESRSLIGRISFQIDEFEFDWKETRRAEHEYMNIHPPPQLTF